MSQFSHGVNDAFECSCPVVESVATDALCVRVQALYERVLEMRILLQKAVVGANRLPLPDATVALLAHSPPQPTSASAASGHQGMRSDADIAEEEEKEGLEGSRTVSGLQQKLTSYSNAACETLSQLMELHDTLIASPHVSAPVKCSSVGSTCDTPVSAVSGMAQGKTLP